MICFTSYPNPELSTEPKKKGILWSYIYIYTSKFNGFILVCLYHVLSVHLKFKGRRRGKLPSAVGPNELFKVVEEMYRGKSKKFEWMDV